MRDICLDDSSCSADDWGALVTVSRLTDAERMERAQRKELENQNYRRFYEQACRNRALKHVRKNSEKGVGDQDAKSGKSGALLLPQLSLLSLPLPALSPSDSTPPQPLPSPAVAAGTPKDSPRAGSALAPTMTVARADSRGSPTSSTVSRAPCVCPVCCFDYYDRSPPPEQLLTPSWTSLR